MSMAPDKKTRSPHLIIIGFDEIVCNKYLRCIEDAIHERSINSYSIIDLDSQKDEIEKKIRKLRVKPKNRYYLPDRRKTGIYFSPQDFNSIMDSIKRREKKLKIYIATELKEHD